MKDISDLIARIFLSTIFLYEAYDSVAFFKSTKETMTLYGIVWRQDMLLTASIWLMVVGGISLLIGYRAKMGAFLLLCYYIPLTFIVHSFWNDAKEVQRFQAILFMKNLAICGGLLLVIANGSGKYSVRRLLTTLKVR